MMFMAFFGEVSHSRKNANLLQDNVAKLLAEFATAKQKKDDLQQQFEERTVGVIASCCNMELPCAAAPGRCETAMRAR